MFVLEATYACFEQMKAMLLYLAALAQSPGFRFGLFSHGLMVNMYRFEKLG
jgi:hypothetical protein